MRVEDRKGEDDDEKNARQPSGDRRQDVGCLRAKNVLCDAPAERRAESFAFGPLHQDDEHHEEGHKRLKHE